MDQPKVGLTEALHSVEQIGLEGAGGSQQLPVVQFVSARQSQGFLQSRFQPAYSLVLLEEVNLQLDLVAQQVHSLVLLEEVNLQLGLAAQQVRVLIHSFSPKEECGVRLSILSWSRFYLLQVKF